MTSPLLQRLAHQPAVYAIRHQGRKFLDLQRGEEFPSIRGLESGPGDGEPGSGSGEPALYIHIPFCRALCPYCSFNRNRFQETQTRRYFQNLRRELDIYLERGRTFSSIYFGGGTPTVMMDELLDFLGYLHSRMEIRDISLETNPRDVSAGNVEALREAGVRRLSIGVQSFDREVLKSIGRSSFHGNELLERLSLARGAFDTLNIDLIYNLPLQTRESFRRDLARFRSLDIQQVTFYPLMPSPQKTTRLERQFGTVDTSRERRFYDLILKTMRASGYRPSTPWCFSKGDQIIDEYIIEHDDYIGIGSGAVSLERGIFHINTFSLERYEKYLREGNFPVMGWRRLSELEAMCYYLLTRLFGLELDEAHFRLRFGAALRCELGGMLRYLKLAGTIREADGKLRVTREGMYHVSAMMREFFMSLNRLRELGMRKGH